MPRHIVKIKDHYLDWSTVVDAPVTHGMTLDEFKEYYKEEYGLSSMAQLDDHLKRVEEKGVSARDYDSPIQLIAINHAGPNWSHLSIGKIYRIFCQKKKTNVKGFYFDYEKDEWLKIPGGTNWTTKHKYC